MYDVCLIAGALYTLSFPPFLILSSAPSLSYSDGECLFNPSCSRDLLTTSFLVRLPSAYAATRLCWLGNPFTVCCSLAVLFVVFLGGFCFGVWCSEFGVLIMVCFGLLWSASGGGEFGVWSLAFGLLWSASVWRFGVWSLAFGV